MARRERLAQNSQKTGRRGNGRQFKPGQSGNPGGRPKLPPEIVELRALCREHTVGAVAAIVNVMANKKAPASARVAAASEILDRGWGRATTHVDANLRGDAAIRELMEHVGRTSSKFDVKP